MSALDELAIRSRRLRIADLRHDVATHHAALLMTMDGQSAEPVDVQLSMADGDLDGVTTLLDVLDLMRTPVTITVGLPLRGIGAVLFAAHQGRRVLHARAGLDLRLPSETTTSGGNIEAAARFTAAQRDSIVTRLSTRSGLGAEYVTALLTSGGFLEATACVEAGLADAIS